ncbi:MAG TPA: hypothetical protein VEQ59_12195, partial [Polyangiaceae bacterium]|nr:hypothetical protein [Polyangiaceae bacterium]
MPVTRIRRAHRVLLELAALALVLGPVPACVGGDAPADPYALPGRDKDIVAAAGSSTTGDPPPPAGSRQSHFPLVDGAS